MEIRPKTDEELVKVPRLAAWLQWIHGYLPSFPHALKPQGHVVVSAGLGAIFWVKSRDIRTLFISLLFGVLIDLDHLFDYFYATRRLTFNAGDFFKTRYWKISGRIFVIFHAFEYLPLVFFFWQGMKGRKWAVAATSAMSVHLVADHLVNELQPFGYFLIYRIAHRFRAAEILDLAKIRRMEGLRTEHKLLASQGKLPLMRRIVTFFV